MGIITFTEIETGKLIEIDTEIVFIASLTHHDRGTVILLEEKDQSCGVVRSEHHVRESFNKVVDALALAGHSGG